jgi:hypothetical protein
MPVNAIAMPFSFAAAIDSSSLIDPPRLETGVRLAILLDASELNQWINWSQSQA